MRFATTEERLPDHDLRLNEARAHAAWELGDPSFADDIIAIYTGEQGIDPEAEEAWESA